MGINTGLSRYIANGEETNSSFRLFVNTLLNHSSIEINQLHTYLVNASVTKEDVELKMGTSDTKEIELIQTKMKNLLEYIFQEPRCIVGTIDEESVKFLLDYQFNIEEGAKNNLLESIEKCNQKLSPNPQTEQPQVQQIITKSSDKATSSSAIAS